MTSSTVTTARKVSKSTFYENQTLYGDIACGFSSQNVELELDMDSDSENEGALPCWDDEDRQFFSEGDSSRNDNDVDDEMLSEESSVEIHESFMQPEQQLLVSLWNITSSYSILIQKDQIITLPSLLITLIKWLLPLN